MRLSEALTIIRQQARPQGPAFDVCLACGFTPLHIRTFLTAHLQLALEAKRIEVHTGLYGDFLGNVQRISSEPAHCGVILMEWPDLDARLGLRNLHGWRERNFTDVLDTAEARLAAVHNVVDSMSPQLPVVVSLPTLALPPIEPTFPTWRFSGFQLQLQQLVTSFAATIANQTNVKIVNSAWLDHVSPPSERFDPGSEILDGFPYSIKHAAALSEVIANLIQSPAPKKGLVTDLDNTLWKGILGEIGPAGISWDLDHKSHMHAAYQELLRSLAESGVLIGVATKNDPALVEEAFGRPDLILRKEQIFPMEVHWNPKSDSIARILDTWNIGADSVVFVDDSPAELAEVKAAYPAVETIQFPKSPQDIYKLLAQLRNLFVKPFVTEEDRIRLDTIRRSSTGRERLQTAGVNAETFLEQAQSVLQFFSEGRPPDPRVLELINKTNQFNLNGRRYTETELNQCLGDPCTFLLKVNYADKFGPLGNIAVVLGKYRGKTLAIESWVMSCRAFSRRIEHACLDHLFRKFDASAIELAFEPTERNKPLQDFLAEFLGERPSSRLRLPKDLFYAKCVRLFHRVREEVYG
jgi:FkbH-like protein